MKCPICTNINLMMTERNGVEIDYCSSCRGVWLDRGELDKIIELSTSKNEIKKEEYHREKFNNDRFDDDKDNLRHDKRRRESFLGDLFDF